MQPAGVILAAKSGHTLGGNGRRIHPERVTHGNRATVAVKTREWAIHDKAETRGRFCAISNDPIWAAIHEHHALYPSAISAIYLQSEHWSDLHRVSTLLGPTVLSDLLSPTAVYQPSSALGRGRPGIIASAIRGLSSIFCSLPHGFLGVVLGSSSRYTAVLRPVRGNASEPCMGGDITTPISSSNHCPPRASIHSCINTDL